MFCSGFPGAGFTAPIRSRSTVKCPTALRLAGNCQIGRATWTSTQSLRRNVPASTANSSVKSDGWLGELKACLHSWCALGFNERFTSYVRVLSLEFDGGLSCTMLCIDHASQWNSGIVFDYIGNYCIWFKWWQGRCLYRMQLQKEALESWPSIGGRWTNIRLYYSICSSFRLPSSKPSAWRRECLLVDTIEAC